jgi:hypothetical protein
VKPGDSVLQTIDALEQDGVISERAQSSISMALPTLGPAKLASFLRQGSFELHNA